MRRVARAPVLLLGLLVLAACSAPPPPTPASPLRVAVASSAQPLVAALAQAWEASGQGTPLDVWETNTALALARLGAGQADLAATCWKPGEGTPTPAAVQAGWHWVPIAYDAIVLVVHPENPLDGLSLAQVRELFAGRVARWSDLGGSPEEVLPVSREEGSGTRWDFETLVMQGKRVTPAAVVMPSGRAVVEFVGEHPGAVGYVGLARAREKVKVLALDGVRPSVATVREGTYPLPRLCYLVLPASPLPRAEA
ncbi:MAG: substrate-binding domain-containing protein, partial [Anaerolineae bacterium]